MPWTQVNNLTAAASDVIPSVTVNVGTNSSHFARAPQVATGDQFTIHWVFPEGVITDRFFYAPADIEGITIDSFGFSSDTNTVTMTCTKLTSGVSIDGVRMGFPVGNASYDSTASQLFSIVTT